jgi:autotransporter-associated beta strand protein
MCAGAAFVAVIAWFPASAQAQSYTWGGTGSTTTTTDYNTGTNWSNQAGGPPPVAGGQAAVFDSTGSATVIVGTPISPDTWTFNANSRSFSISGADVTFSAGGITNNANLGQTVTISNNIGGGAAQVQQLGASTLVLSGTNTYSGDTTISAGTLVAASTGAFGSSTVRMTGGTVQFAVSSSFTNAISIDSGTPTISAGGQTVNLDGSISLAANTTLQFGKPGDTGALLLSNAGSVDPTARLVIAGGTVQDNGGGAITGITFFTASTTVNAGATLDFNNSFNQAIRNLNGGGLVKMGDAGNNLNLFIDDGTTQTFAGTITGQNGHVLIEATTGFTLATMVFTGVNTYTGGTDICACAALQLGDPTHTGSIVGAVLNGGVFDIVNANTAGITSITNDGSFAPGFGVTTFRNTSTASNIQITNINGGITQFFGHSDAGTATIVNEAFSATAFNNSSSAQNATITNEFRGATVFKSNSTAGNAFITNNSSGSGAFPYAGLGPLPGLGFFGSSTAGNATIVNNNGGGIVFGLPFISFGFDPNEKSTAGNANIINNAGSTLQFNAFSTAGNATITTLDGGATGFFDNSTGGNARFITNGTGYVDFSGSIGPNSDKRITAGSIEGSGTYYIGAGVTLVVGSNNLSTSLTGTSVIADFNPAPPCGCPVPGIGNLEKVGSGVLSLFGTNTYTGTTTVNGGFLDVEGSIAGSRLTTVNLGGALTGAGTVGNTLIANGGLFLPGNGFGTSTKVQGSLAFASGALYLVQLNSISSTFADVTGAANVNGTVGVAVDPNGIVLKKYMILQAAGGVGGAFTGVAAPGGLVGTVTYDPTHAYLNLDLNYGAKNNLNINQQNVANALSNFFNANGGIAAVFATLTPSGLSQAAGEIATGTQQATFNAMNLFIQLLTDPFVSGRGGSATAGGGATPYAEDESSMAYAARKSSSARDALAKIPTKAEIARNNLLDNRWSVWGSAFGGGANLSGNATVGSTSADVRAFGFAAGADYRISPVTLAGFALAGGGTNFSLNGFGSGRSDMFQAGAFVRHTIGAAYVTGALAYGGQQVTTDRTVTAAGFERLRAQFDANAWTGRIEGGRRYATPFIGITPYAAAQFTTISLPSYAEQVLAGAGNFALRYNAKDVTDTRTELGVRTDRSLAMPNGVLTLRGRLAWAHDFNTDRSAGAVFQTLPGAFFVVNGASQAHDLALATASAEMKWLNGWSAAAAFEGEFSDVSNSYAGKGVVRYTW